MHRKRLKKPVYLFIMTVLLMVSYFCFTWVIGIDLISRVGQTATITSWMSSVNSMSEEEIKETLEQCYEYNAKLAEEQESEPFVYQGASVTDDEYDEILNVDGLGKMAVITCSKANVNLPISHGTTSDVMQNGAGHVYGTSLPVGGESTHAVITSHTGLKSATLFSELTDLEIGDTFEIKVLNQKLKYEVDQIKVVLPEDVADYVQIEEGKDYVTLCTCTPYGSNTHRLLVRGVRVESDDDTMSTADMWLEVGLQNAKEIALCGLWIIAPFIIATIFIRKETKKERKKSITPTREGSRLE